MKPKVEIRIENTSIFADLIRRSKKRINISVKSDGSVVISAPPGVSHQEIERIVSENSIWIQEKIKQNKLKKSLTLELNKDEIFYRGDIWKFIKVPQLGSHIITDEKNKILSSGFTLENYNLIKWYKDMANFCLPTRTKKLASILRFSTGKITTRTARKRWGSCNNRGDISLNSKLILAPEWVCDSIILHELTHTVIMNHSKKFWQHLYKIDPNWDRSKEWLNKNFLFIENIWNKI